VESLGKIDVEGRATSFIPLEGEQTIDHADRPRGPADLPAGSLRQRLFERVARVVVRKPQHTAHISASLA
jgi:hypothetical protein